MLKSVLGVGDYAVVGCMLVVSAAVGIYFRFSGGRQKTTAEYLMGDKAMGIGPVAFSLMASYMSAIAILGIPAEVYMYGTQLSVWVCALPFGNLLTIYSQLPVYFDMNVSTSYEYLERRFGRTTRTIISILFIIDSVLYMAVVIYAPSVAVNSVTEFSTWNLVLTFVAVATFYCYLGGLKAVLWTDVFQSILMYIPVLAVVFYVVINYGLVEVYHNAKERGQLIFFDMSVDPSVRYTFWSTITSSLLYGVGTFGSSQTQLQRIMSIGDFHKAKWAVLWSVLLIVVFQVSCVSAGVVMSTLFYDCDPLLDPRIGLNSQDQLMTYSILQEFGKIPGVTGLCLAGILSAALSTLSSILNSLSSVTVEDFIKPYCFRKHLTDAWMAHIAKLLAVVFGASCLLVVYMVANFRGVLEASTMLNAFITGPTTGVYILGFFTATANEPGTLVGMVAGSAFIGWISLGAYLAKPPIATLPRSIDGCNSSMNATFDSRVLGTIPVMQNLTLAAEEPYRYIFPLYKISYEWFFPIGIVITVIIGLTVSFISRWRTKSWTVDLRCLSPFVRRFHFDRSENLKSVQPQEEIALSNPTAKLDKET